MTDPSGPFVLTVPLLVALIVAFGWILWSRPILPFRFTGYAVRQGWQIDPMARLDASLRHGRLSAGILAVRDRLLIQLMREHHLTPREVRSRFLAAGRPKDPVVDRACAAVRALETTYSLAFLSEDPERRDLWTRWRRPVWRERARRRFESELSEVESLWPLLEAGS